MEQDFRKCSRCGAELFITSFAPNVYLQKRKTLSLILADVNIAVVPWATGKYVNAV